MIHVEEDIIKLTNNLSDEQLCQVYKSALKIAVSSTGRDEIDCTAMALGFDIQWNQKTGKKFYVKDNIY